MSTNLIGNIGPKISIMSQKLTSSLVLLDRGKVLCIISLMKYDKI